jgi:phage shock protein B
MTFWSFMFVPTILFMVIVLPLAIILHYRSVRVSSRSLNTEDRVELERMLETVDRLTERIHSLEAILDVDHPDWRMRARQNSTTRSAEQ